jgi:hypothetical protein
MEGCKMKTKCGRYRQRNKPGVSLKENKNKIEVETGAP